MTLRFSTLTASLLLAAAFAAPAQAFSDDEARQAILDLRQQLQQMTEQNNNARLQLADRIHALEDEIAQLRNQVEEAGRPQSGGPVGPGLGPVSGPQGASGGNADSQEKAAYDQGIDLFRKAQYKDAADSLAAFVSLYPNSPLANSARFYQGSSRYALKDFKGAIAQLSSLVQDAPQDPRAPDALLVIAGSQIEQNNRTAAKATLQQLVKTYPTAPAADTAKKRLQLLQ